MNRLLDVWWADPLLMCLVLTGIHGYLGIHVLKRKVIFVDLAMAQIAAMGAAYGILLGYDPKDPGDTLALYLFSLGFTLVGAAVISLSRMRQERVPQEAFIGIVYAGASALAMLILAKTSSEGEQIKHMLVGSLLTVSWGKVKLTAAIYAVIGLFHWVFRHKFFLISENPEAAEAAGVSVRFWDFLFYVSFGVVITSSVSIAGVLLVFSYLVVPGVIAVMYADRTRVRIAIAWAVGTVVSIMGMIISNLGGGFPTGPSIVAGFVVALVVASVAHYVRTHAHWGVALGRLGAGVAVVALAIWGSTHLSKSEEHHHEAGDPHSRLMEALASENDTAVIDALHHVERMKDVHAIRPVMELLKSTRSERVIEHAAEAPTLEAKGRCPVERNRPTRTGRRLEGEGGGGPACPSRSPRSRRDGAGDGQGRGEDCARGRAEVLRTVHRPQGRRRSGGPAVVEPAGREPQVARGDGPVRVIRESGSGGTRARAPRAWQERFGIGRRELSLPVGPDRRSRS
jgi:zinc/manganese transport system permease protein